MWVYFAIVVVLSLIIQVYIQIKTVRERNLKKLNPLP